MADKLTQDIWEVFKQIPSKSLMWGATHASLWVDDCLYVIVYNIPQGLGFIKLTWYQEHYDDWDLAEHLDSALLILRKICEEHNIKFSTTWHDNKDARFAEFYLSPIEKS